MQAAAPPAQTVPPLHSTTPAQEFQLAMQRVRLHEPDETDSAALRGYVIYDYLLAARLRRDLRSTPSEELDTRIDQFLKTRATLPVSRELQSDWLTSLAKRARWDWFLPRAADATAPALVCSRLAGSLATGDPDTFAAEALRRWSTPQRQPPECDPVFAWLRVQKLITPELAEARARALLEGNNPHLAREVLGELPAGQAVPLERWAHLLEAPKPALQEVEADPHLSVEPAALLAGFDKLARLDAPAAAALLPRLLERPELTVAMQLRLRKSAALGAAFSRDAGAVQAFATLPESAADIDVQEWRVRAALWAGDWPQALSWIALMPQSLAAQPRWKYWRGRCVEATSGTEAANPLYEELAGLRDFYGYLAADRLHRPYMLNARPSAEDMPLQATLAADPGLIRARALFEADMEEEASYEWAAGVSRANPAVRLQAAHLAARWGWYSQSIITLSQLGELDDVRMRYPRPYTDAIAEASKLTQLPTDWILAVMRQESLFRDDAVSRAGARGLMQMQPTTATAVARRWHLPAPPRDGGVDPLADIERGAAHLRELLDRYGQLGLTLAAYNAGAVPVARWLPEHPLDADIWIENIPYSETRNYVQRIIEHIVAFAWVRDAEPPRLTVLLPQVSPATLAAQTARP